MSFSILDFIREDDPTFYRRILRAQDQFLLEGGDDESGRLIVLAEKGWRDVQRSADEVYPDYLDAIKRAFADAKTALNRDRLIAMLEQRDEREVFTLVSGSISVLANSLLSITEKYLSLALEASGTRAVRRLKQAIRDSARTRRRLGFRAAATDEEIEEILQSFGFDTTNPEAVKWIQEHAGELVGEVSETTRERIRELVEDAFVEGVDVRDLTNQIADEIGDSTRAETIARTETMTASNQGQAEAWNQAVEEGLLTGTEKKEWIVTPDDRLCPICEPMDGVTVGLYESFDVDGERIDLPPAHPRCRCTIGLSIE